MSDSKPKGPAPLDKIFSPIKMDKILNEPTVPGWYWYRTDRFGGGWLVVHLHDDTRVSIGAWLYSAADLTDIGQWGPKIEPPGDDK